MFAKAPKRRPRPASRPGLEVLEGRVVLTVLTPLFRPAAALAGPASFAPAEAGAPHFAAWHGSGFSFDGGSARLSAAAPAGSAYGRALLAFDPVAFTSPKSVLHFDVAGLAEQGDTTLTLSFVPVQAGSDGSPVEDLAARQTLQSWKLTPDPAPQADAAVDLPLAAAPNTVGSVQVELATAGQASVQLSNFRLDPASVSAAFTADAAPAAQEAAKAPAADTTTAATPPAHDTQPAGPLSVAGPSSARAEEAAASSNVPATSSTPPVTLGLANLGGTASAATSGMAVGTAANNTASARPGPVVPASADVPVVPANAVQFTGGNPDRPARDGEERLRVSNQAPADAAGPEQNPAPTPAAEPARPKGAPAPAPTDDTPPAAPPPEMPPPPPETAGHALWPFAAALAGLSAFRPPRAAAGRRLRLRA